MRDFASVFSSLRRESGKSQRTAAQEMKISQALLSHYENGVREPRLEFVSNACEYYGVSADYMLGRTMEKGGFAAGAQYGALSSVLSLTGQTGKQEFDCLMGQLALLAVLASGEEICPGDVSQPVFQQQCSAALAVTEARLIRELAAAVANLDLAEREKLIFQAREAAVETVACFTSERKEQTKA